MDSKVRHSRFPSWLSHPQKKSDRVVSPGNKFISQKFRNQLVNFQAGLRRLGTENPADTWKPEIDHLQEGFLTDKKADSACWLGSLKSDPGPPDQSPQAPALFGSCPQAIFRPACLPCKNHPALSLSLSPGLVRPHPLPTALLAGGACPSPCSQPSSGL